MLEIKNVHKYFHKGKKNQIHVINDTTLSLEKNGLVALLGPSGCGKTTLLNVIGGMDRIKKGEIYVNGQKISSRFTKKVDTIRNLNIGYIFQDYKLVDHLSVFDNVAIVLKMLGLKDPVKIKERVEYVLDCVGMLRYQRRPAGMLSGGERQRVGIARALVKNPNIILADEPTGNLDSKNTLEIMKIIKAISRDRLVILVTHEQELARFYASRIIEIEDGKVINDYENDQTHELDYEIDNCFYLKDFKFKEKFQKKDTNICLYQNESEEVSLEMVVKNGNIYIKSNNDLKVEAVDETSSIEFIDEHYVKLAKSKVLEYQFDFEKLENGTFKKRYASVMNPMRSILGGFHKVFAYPILKKILLAGFFLAGMFIMYSISSIAATLKVHEEDFVTMNPQYLILEKNNITTEEYFKYEGLEGVEYIVPGNSLVSFSVPYDDYYQTANSTGTLTGSLVKLDHIQKENIILGRMPENDQEIVVDRMTIKKMLETKENFQMAGILSVEDMLERIVQVTNMADFKIVGVTDLGSPSIYAAASSFLSIILNSQETEERVYYDTSESNSNTSGTLTPYSFYQDKITLKKGRIPANDYEIMVPIMQEHEMPLNKEISQKVNDHKLIVVGYYTSKYGYQNYFTTEKTLLYQKIRGAKALTIAPKDREQVLSTLKNEKLNIYDSYERSREIYQEERKENVRSTIIVSGIILAISFIEIFLMIRSSFLSRIKEIGIYRAIGLKKIDIYQMFAGEIIAITTLAGIPGLVLMAYILNVISGISILSRFIIITPAIILFAVLVVYLFNLIVGLFPVYYTIRKRPAEILSRYDLD